MPRGHLHVFSEDDDQLIIEHSRGVISLRQLVQRTRATRGGLLRRAKELGVQLHVYKRRRRYLEHRQLRAGEAVTDSMFADRGSEPPYIERDRLLERLIKFHGKQLAER